METAAAETAAAETAAAETAAAEKETETAAETAATATAAAATILLTTKAMTKSKCPFQMKEVTLPVGFTSPGQTFVRLLEGGSHSSIPIATEARRQRGRVPALGQSRQRRTLRPRTAPACHPLCTSRE